MNARILRADTRHSGTCCPPGHTSPPGHMHMTNKYKYTLTQSQFTEEEV